MTCIFEIQHDFLSLEAIIIGRRRENAETVQCNLQSAIIVK